MKRKDTISTLLKISMGMLAMMLFMRVSPLYQMIPIILLLLTALVLVVIESANREKEEYKRYKKKRASS